MTDKISAEQPMTPEQLQAMVEALNSRLLTAKAEYAQALVSSLQVGPGQLNINILEMLLEARSATFRMDALLTTLVQSNVPLVEVTEHLTARYEAELAELKKPRIAQVVHGSINDKKRRQ